MSNKPSSQFTHWLIKAEPDSRIEKGVDVKFSIDDFEKSKVSSWEGVRNHEAKKYLKDQMKLGQFCLFYASNCKTPGITGIAKVVKEGYPDYNAWDEKHPYFDPKSKKENPTWYMVDVEFVSRLPHLVPLSLLQYLSNLSSTSTPSSSSPSSSPIPYLTKSHLSSISESQLIKRGRLSVQPCSGIFFETCKLLGEKGGFEELMEEEVKKKKKGKGKVKEQVKEEEEEEEEEEEKPSKPTNSRKRKVKPEEEEEEEEKERKPSTRTTTTKKSKSTTSRKVMKKEVSDDDEVEESEEEEKMPTRGSRSRSKK